MVLCGCLTRVGLRNRRKKESTYIHNEEVQPTPGVGEILDETISNPFQQHLQDEDVGEDPVGILQNDTDRLPLLDVHVLEGLWRSSKPKSASVKVHRDDLKRNS